MLDLTRQADLIPEQKLEDISGITIIGCGAIGSHIAIQLAKMGIRELVIYDFDVVDGPNLSSQGFGLSDLGKKKVEAVKNHLTKEYGCSVITHEEPYKDQKIETPIVISAVDNMRTRSLIWEAAKRDKIPLFVDGRMGAEYAQVFSIVNVDGEEYERNFMFSDNEVAPAPCTEKATIYCASAISAMMTSSVKSFIVEGNVKIKGVGFDLVNLSTHQLL